MLENVTLLYVSGSADGKTDFFLFSVDSLSVWEEALFHTVPSLRCLRLKLSPTCLLSLRAEAAADFCLRTRAGGRPVAGSLPPPRGGPRAPHG